MPNQPIELDEIWKKLAKERHISGEDLIAFFKNNGQDAESAYAFFNEWQERKVLYASLTGYVKGTKVPTMIRRTDEVGVKHLRTLGYILK